MKATTEVKQRNYTLADIAKRMGISSTAVSMALRDSGGVSEKLRQQVLSVAEEMNYKPALAAKMLRSKKTGQIGLYLPIGQVEALCGSCGFIAPSMAHFVKQCENKKYSYHIEFGEERSNFDPPSQLTGRIVDGVLLLGEQNRELMDWLNENNNYKWVSIIEKAEYCVLSDNKSGIYRAVEHLAAMGHRNIAFAHCDLDYDAHAAALCGYRSAVNDFGLNKADYMTVEFRSKHNELCFNNINEWADFILSDERCPSAVICNDQKISNALMFKAAAKGISIPNDLSMISYGIRAMSESVYPNTTTVEVDYGAIMEKGINMLIKRISRQEVKEKEISVEPKLVKRDSVAPLNRS